jgi:cytochrome c oxidase assembly protein subunit 15
LAYVTTGIVLSLAWRARGSDVPRWCKVAAAAMVGHTLVQVTLGALTVLYFVPISLASLHQLNATLLLGQVVLFVFSARRG